MRTTANHLVILGVLVLFLPTTCGVEISAQQATDEQLVSAAPGVPAAFWAFTVLAGIVLVVLVALLLYRLFKGRPEGKTFGIDEIRPRALIGGMMGVLLLYGFFFTLYHLLGMLPRDNTEADNIPGEYWLFIGQALGIIGSLALNVATYYFGSASSGEDEGQSNAKRDASGS